MNHVNAIRGTYIEPAVNIRQLTVFQALMKGRTATGAAAILGVSQPAVSQSLQQMEADLGLRLFQRINGRMSPTPEAEAIASEAGKILGSIDGLQRMIEEMRDGRARTINIAAIHTLAHVFVPRAVQQLSQKRPGVRIAVHVLPTLQIIEQVTSGTADVGLVTDSVDASTARFDDLLARDVACILPPGSDLASKSRIRPSDLRGQRLVCYDPQIPFSQRIARVFASAGEKLDISVQVSSSTLLAWLVESGMGVGLIEPFALLGRQRFNHVVKPFHPRIPIRPRIVYPPQRPLTQMAQEFCAIYRAIVEDMTASADA